MKANEAPKSKFTYPNKLYARCKDNKTLDISYVPQTIEAVEYTHTNAFIEKACKFLQDRIEHDSIDYPMATHWLIEDFRKYMEESKV